MMFASGAIACAHSTSRLVSRVQAFRSWLPGLWLLGGGDFTSVLPFQYRCWNVGTPDPHDWPGSPHMCGNFIWVSKFARSDAMFGLPNESMIAIVIPWPS